MVQRHPLTTLSPARQWCSSTPSVPCLLSWHVGRAGLPFFISSLPGPLFILLWTRVIAVIVHCHLFLLLVIRVLKVPQTWQVGAASGFSVSVTCPLMCSLWAQVCVLTAPVPTQLPPPGAELSGRVTRRPQGSCLQCLRLRAGLALACSSPAPVPLPVSVCL